MVGVACLVGRAVHLNDGYYTAYGLVLIAVAIVLSAAVTLLPPIEAIDSLPAAVPVVLLSIAIVVELIMLLRGTTVARGAIATIAVLGLLQAFRLGTLRVPLFAVVLAAFCVVASIVVVRVEKTPLIDVFYFQQIGSARLLDGQSPYQPAYPNLYGGDTPFYGPGVLDAGGELTIGLPYPPMSLLLTLPAYVLGGDVRYADVAAMAATALLMLLFRPSRWTGLTAMVFLLTPRGLYVIQKSWTETVFVCTFALVMYCALRWRSALPYALGLFFATKQYAVLTVPFIPLLAGSGAAKGDVVRLIAKGGLIAAAITLPFVLWDPHGFWRSVVQFQFMQPLRMDALSYLVWTSRRIPDSAVLMWIPFIAFGVATALLLWRCARTPAHFAAATAVASLVFFAFNKQAFCNYYYFVIATACCAAAASTADDMDWQIRTP
jgi:hypothetical protein